MRHLPNGYHGFCHDFREVFRDDDRRRSFPIPVLIPSPAQIFRCGKNGSGSGYPILHYRQSGKGAQPLSYAEHCPDLQINDPGG
jgi:hypothetical protein